MTNHRILSTAAGCAFLAMACGSSDEGSGRSTDQRGDGAAPTGGSSAGSGGGAGGFGTVPSGGSGGAGDGGVGGGGAGGSPVVVPDVACAPFTAGNELTVCTATYLAGPGGDAATSVEIAPDGSVVYGGTLDGTDLGVAPVSLLSGGTGVVVRLAPDGRSVLGVTRLGAKVNDVAVSLSTGDIVATGDFGLAVLSSDAGTVRWTDPLSGEGRRVAVGTDGSVAALSGKLVTSFDATGAARASFEVAGSTVNDIAVGPGGSVIATGFDQDDGAPCTQLQIPFIRAYDRQGGVSWTDYAWGRVTAGEASDCADSRGVAVSMGRDGKLYFVGESHGGNTIFRRDPTDSALEVSGVVTTDEYTNPYNMNGAAPIGFVARLDPATGRLEAAQRILTRLSSGKGNAARPTAVTADENGNVLVAGSSACCIPDAASRTINGVPAFGGYAGGAFVLMLSPDFQERMLWTGFSGSAGSGASSVAVAAGSGRMAAVLVQEVDQGTTLDAPLISLDGVQAGPGGGTTDGYLAVWRSP